MLLSRINSVGVKSPLERVQREGNALGILKHGLSCGLAELLQQTDMVVL